MPQATAADVQPPAAPAPPGQPVAAPAPPAATLGPISSEQAEFLRLRRSALSTQLESVQERRDDVAEQLRSDETQAAERPGLQERLRVLDERLVQLEQEIATNSAALANAPSRRQESMTHRPGRDFSDRLNPNAVTFFSFLLLMPFAVQLARRYFAPDRGPSRSQIAETRALTERMNQIETAIDTVAIEVERIGESQRFLTAAMTENIRQPGALGVPVPAYESVPPHDRDADERR